jgi:glycosyltransferase involved in cell wall biosynthesis
MTPSYNQGRFLEETIRSVLLQGYPNLEYIVIDGGSADNSTEIIRKYDPWLAYWVSEPDRGQSHAINKGFTQATGEVFAWLNSDDVYLPGAIPTIASAYRSAPESIVAAPVLNVQHGVGGIQPTNLHKPVNLCLEPFVKFWDEQSVWHQPGIFFPRQAWHVAGGLDETLRYAMDYDLLCRILRHASVTYVTDTVALFRLHGQSKTVAENLGMFSETMKVSRRYWHLVSDIDAGAFYAHCTDYLVRWAGTQALRGRFSDAAAYLRASLALHPKATLVALLVQLAEGARRRGSRDGRAAP